jgi:hypothetical protein
MSLLLAVAMSACTDNVDPKDPQDTDIPDDTEQVDTDTTDTDVPPTADLAVTVCEELPPAQTGLCDVTAGDDELTVVRGTVLGTQDIWVGGQVAFDASGVITCVGCDCLDDLPFTPTTITCGEGVISPGLINPHDHLTFSEGPPIPIPDDRRYDHRHDWRGSLSTPRNDHGSGSTGNGNRWVEIRQLIGGTTTVIGSGWADGMLRNPDEGARGDEGLNAPSVLNQTFPLGDSSESRRSNCDWS